MATQPVTQTAQAGNTYLHKWSLTSANLDGAPISMPGAPDRCFQALGTFGGATLVFQGSLDGGTTWFTLHDPTNTALAVTAAGGGGLLENPLIIRPFLSVAGAGAAIDVYLFSRAVGL